MMVTRRLLLSVDPGDKTGYAIFNFDTAELLKMEIVADTAMPGILSSFTPSKFLAVVYEDFILYASKAKEQTGSRFKAVQVIGMLKMWSENNGIRMVRQPAQFLENGYKASGMPRAKKHEDSHDRDAYVHGWVYLDKIGKVRSGSTPSK